TCRILTLAIADLKLPRAVLVGACIQGLVAARIGELAPELFPGLIVAQTADFEGEMRWASESIDMHGNLAKPFEGQINFRLARERATVDWWSAYVAGPKLPLEDFQDKARKVLKCGCSYALASQIQKWQAMEPTPELRPGIPSAVVWGTSDKSHAATDKRSILRYLPDAHYVERDDLGHFPDLESPLLIAEIADALLRRSS
ncbi:MAG: alpha/beta hydrolase, partial [Pseudomonadota bacterium]